MPKTWPGATEGTELLQSDQFPASPSDDILQISLEANKKRQDANLDRRASVPAASASNGSPGGSSGPAAAVFGLYQEQTLSQPAPHTPTGAH